MSHKVNIEVIADQEITINGKRVNIYDIRTLVLDGEGRISDVLCECQHCEYRWAYYKEVRTDET